MTKLTKILFVTTALTLVSCQHAKVEVRDQAWFVDKGELGALELHTMVDTKQKITKADWDNMRFGMLCTTPQTFGEIKKTIEKLCSYYKYCEYPDIKNLLHTIEYLQLKGEAGYVPNDYQVVP